MLGTKRSQGWKLCNEQFRLRKAQKLNSYWAEIVQELGLLYLYAPVISNGTPRSKMTYGHKSYQYNHKINCNNALCSYIHRCLRCNDQHQVINCLRQEIDPSRFNMVDNGYRHQRESTSIPILRPRFPSNAQRFNTETLCMSPDPKCNK